MGRYEKFIEEIAPIVLDVFGDNSSAKPSVVIAQAILESGAGTSELAKVNNIFGLNNYHDGYLTDDAGNYPLSVPQERDGIITYSVENMASFPSLESCVKSLRKWYTRPKYSKLKDLDANAQCDFLQGRYATSTKYASSLKKLITKYDLTRFDKTYFIQFGAFEVELNATTFAFKLRNADKLNVKVEKHLRYYRVTGYHSHNFDEVQKKFNEVKNVAKCYINHY